jgi:ABC-type nitrate/sulfonate/bicarbonate transport system permease component
MAMSVAPGVGQDVGRAGRTFRPGQILVRGAGVLVYLRTMLVFALLWYGAAALISNRLLLPSPVEVFGALRETALDGDLVFNGATSLTRLVISVALAALVGLPLGILIGFSRFWRDVFDLPIELLRPISGIAWIPLALFMFGVGNTLPVFIMFYTALFPLVLGTAAGVRGVDRRLVAAARTMGVTGLPMMTRVIVPAALPSIMVALRLAVAASWTAVVAAELVGAPSGVGYSIEYYRDMLETDHVIAFIAVIGFLGFLTDRCIRLMESRLAPWSRDRRTP